MIFRGVALIVFLCGLVFAAQAQDVAAARVISGDEFALNDGRTVRLAGIEAAMPAAKTFLESAIAGHAVILQDAVPDRYGRVAATVYAQGQKQSLQDAMLGAGLAFVYPAVGDEARLDERLALERAARLARRGYWADHPDVSAGDAGKLYGKYGFVSGTVVKAERVKNKVYLNFDADWRTDFTIAIAAHDVRAFKNQGIDLLSWQGKKVRVRGWVKRDFGPMITITDPHQIELLN